MMVYDTQNYWVYGLYPSLGILNTRERVLETGSVFVLSWREISTLLSLLQRANGSSD
jgi:hypothetical protein